jgi:hypothetical protein
VHVARRSFMSSSSAERNSMEDDEHDTKVGYGKPPAHSRFKKGKSGNAKGRPPRIKPGNDLRAILERAANEVIEINGQVMTMAEVEMRTLQRMAAKGNVAASRHLANLRAVAGVGQSKQDGGGVLVVPGMRPLHEWSISAAIQQAPYRENLMENNEDEER